MSLMFQTAQNQKITHTAGADGVLEYLCFRTLSLAEHLVLKSQSHAHLLPPQRLAGGLLVLSFRDSGLLSLTFPASPTDSSMAGKASDISADQGLLGQLSWVIGRDIPELCRDAHTLYSAIHRFQI
mmetsp:Transcript_4538/g.7253  ORF Transcript_4538/g.7253 Transcript_4538/m.7253 type:complete len:126 (-) Transcript_4538:342-719(-)